MRKHILAFCALIAFMVVSDAHGQVSFGFGVDSYYGPSFGFSVGTPGYYDYPVYYAYPSGYTYYYPYGYTYVTPCRYCYRERYYDSGRTYRRVYRRRAPYRRVYRRYYA